MLHLRNAPTISGAKHNLTSAQDDLAPGFGKMLWDGYIVVVAWLKAISLIAAGFTKLRNGMSGYLWHQFSCRVPAIEFHCALFGAGVSNIFENESQGPSLLCVSMASTCSLNRSKIFVKLLKWGANYSDIFWGTWPKYSLATPVMVVV